MLDFKHSDLFHTQLIQHQLQSDVPWTAEPGSPPPALGAYPAGYPAAVDHGRQ